MRAAVLCAVACVAAEETGAGLATAATDVEWVMAKARRERSSGMWIKDSVAAGTGAPQKTSTELNLNPAGQNPPNATLKLCVDSTSVSTSVS